MGEGKNLSGSVVNIELRLGHNLKRQLGTFIKANSLRVNTRLQRLISVMLVKRLNASSPLWGCLSTIVTGCLATIVTGCQLTSSLAGRLILKCFL